MSSLEPTPANLEGLTEHQRTIFIGEWFSVCGNCGGNAAYREESHEMHSMEGDGCHVRWDFVSSDSGDKSVAQLRPDLKWHDPDTNDEGITLATEHKIIGDMKQVIVDPQRLN